MKKIFCHPSTVIACICYVVSPQCLQSSILGIPRDQNLTCTSTMYIFTQPVRTLPVLRSSLDACVASQSVKTVPVSTYKGPAAFPSKGSLFLGHHQCGQHTTRPQCHCSCSHRTPTSADATDLVLASLQCLQLTWHLTDCCHYVQEIMSPENLQQGPASN